MTLRVTSLYHPKVPYHMGCKKLRGMVRAHCKVIETKDLEEKIEKRNRAAKTQALYTHMRHGSIPNISRLM